MIKKIIIFLILVSCTKEVGLDIEINQSNFTCGGEVKKYVEQLSNNLDNLFQFYVPTSRDNKNLYLKVIVQDSIIFTIQKKNVNKFEIIFNKQEHKSKVLYFFKVKAEEDETKKILDYIKKFVNNGITAISKKEDRIIISTNYSDSTYYELIKKNKKYDDIWAKNFLNSLQYNKKKVKYNYCYSFICYPKNTLNLNFYKNVTLEKINSNLYLYRHMTAIPHTIHTFLFK